MFINKSNSIIQNASFNLDTLELKVLSKIISMINSKSKDFQYYYEFELKDFKNELALHNTNYFQLKEAVRQLSNKGFEIIKANEKEVYSRWISSVITQKGTGTIKVEIPREMKDYYLDLNGNYTSMKAIYIYKLRSKYSIRLYELLSSWKTKGSITYTLEELKTMFKTGDKYKRFYDFKRKVIEVAQKEFLKKNIDIQFEYKSSGRGNSKKISFKIIDVEKMQDQEAAKKTQEKLSSGDNIDKQIYTDIEKELRKAGINKKIINSLIAEYDEMQIRRNIEYAYKRHQEEPKNNFAGYLINMIKNDFAMKTYEERQEYKKEREKQKNGNSLPIQETNNIQDFKQSLLSDETLFNEFIRFLSLIANQKPGGYVSEVIPKLFIDKNILLHEARLQLFIEKFLKTRGENG